MNLDDYFAALPPKECVDACNGRISKFYMYLDASGRWNVLSNSYRAYYRPTLNLGQTLRFGDKGQFMDVTVNHYRNLIEHAVGMVVNQRVEYAPKAINTDHKSQAQTILAKGLLEYYQRANNFDQVIYKMVRDGFMYGESFMYLGWDVDRGAVVDVDLDTDKLLREGDLKVRIFNTVDVVRDIHRQPDQDHSWYILCERVNKYDLAIQYPHLAEKIKAANDVRSSAAFQYTYNPDLWSVGMASEDYCLKYTLIHKKCPTLPEGRLLEFIDNNCILLDSPLPYDDLPIHRFYISEQEGSPFADTHAWGLLPLQDNVDRLTSAVVTNNAAFAVQSILLPEGAQISEDALNEGLLVLKYKGDKKPEALQLTASAPETYQLIDSMVQNMEKLLAVGAVARQDESAFKTSGSALALLQSTALQFNHQIQAHYVFMLESVGTSILSILRQYASTKRVAVISGKQNKQYLREFESKDLEGIQRVYVDLGNPVMRTIAGNYELATTMVNQGMVKGVDQLVEVLSTGRIEPIYEGESAELMLIRSENENLANNVMQPVLITDNHPLHMREHLVVLANPTDRANPELLQACLDHIQQHVQNLQMMPPELAMIHGIQLPMPAAPVEGEGQMPADPAQEALPNMPNMPTNPMTGEPAE
jgi:hypothetical protein